MPIAYNASTSSSATYSISITPLKAKPVFTYKEGKIFKCSFGGIWKVESVHDHGSASLRCIAAYKPEGARYRTMHDNVDLMGKDLGFNKYGRFDGVLYLLSEIEP